MGCELSHQIGLQLRQFLGQPSRNRLRSQLTRLPSLFQIAFEGGQRHAKQLHDLSSRAALVYRTHHSFPQIFRIRFHTSCSLSLLASRSFTYSITWLNSSASRCNLYERGLGTVLLTVYQMSRQLERSVPKPSRNQSYGKPSRRLSSV